MENRGYSENTIYSAIDRARRIPRNTALRRVIRGQADRSAVFAVTYDPKHPEYPGQTLALYDHCLTVSLILHFNI